MTQASEQDDLSAQQQAFEALAERIAKRVVALQLAPAAVFFLESSKPLSFIASQALVVLEPIVKSLLDLSEYDTFRRGLERRENLETLIRRIEDLEDERIMVERERREARRANRTKRQRWRRGARGEPTAPADADMKSDGDES